MNTTKQMFRVGILLLIPFLSVPGLLWAQAPLLESPTATPAAPPFVTPDRVWVTWSINGSAHQEILPIQEWSAGYRLKVSARPGDTVAFILHASCDKPGIPDVRQLWPYASKASFALSLLPGESVAALVFQIPNETSLPDQYSHCWIAGWGRYVFDVVVEYPAPTPTPFPVPLPTPAPTPFYVSYPNETIVLSQGFGGSTQYRFYNTNPDYGPLFMIKKKGCALPAVASAVMGGGYRRAGYASSGDVDGNGDMDLIWSFGPVTEEGAEYPNVIIPRNPRTHEVIGHSFHAFPRGNERPVEYNGGEVRTAVGNFIGDFPSQIVAGQGTGGSGVVRLFQYTGLAAPLGFVTVGQFYGLSGLAKSTNGGGGINLAAGDVDGDGLDELLVSQTPGPDSLAMFQVLDLQTGGTVEKRTPCFAFPESMRQGIGVSLTVCDLDGDGANEIVAAGLGLNRISVIAPIVENGAVVGFHEPVLIGDPVFSAEENPSGMLSIASGEFNHNPQDGWEIEIGTGSRLEKQETSWVPLLPAPAVLFEVIKIRFDEPGETVRMETLFTGKAPTGFSWDSTMNQDPTSGAAFLSSF